MSVDAPDIDSPTALHERYRPMQQRIVSSILLVLVASLSMLPRIAAGQPEQGSTEPSPSAAAEEPTAPPPVTRKSLWSRIDIGTKLGLSLASLVGKDATSDIAEFTNKPGLTLNLFGNIHLYRQLFLQTEILFASKGRQVESGGMLSDTLNIDYIEVPLLARISVPINERFALYLLAGPTAGFLLRYQVESESDGNITDRTDLARSIDLGLLGGIGARVVLSGPHAVVIEGRYERSLTRFLKEDADIKNRIFAFMLGYQYSLADLFSPEPPPLAEQAASEE